MSIYPYNILICSDEQYHTLTAALFLINYGNIPEYDVKSVLTNKNDKLVLDYDLSIFKKKINYYDYFFCHLRSFVCSKM